MLDLLDDFLREHPELCSGRMGEDVVCQLWGVMEYAAFVAPHYTDDRIRADVAAILDAQATLVFGRNPMEIGEASKERRL